MTRVISRTESRILGRTGFGGFAPLNISVLFTGQSNHSRLFTQASGAAKALFESELEALLPAGSNVQAINGAEGGSYMSLVNADSATAETGTLGNNPFTTTLNSPIVTVSHVDHDLIAPLQKVSFSGATAAGGITVNGDYFVTSIIDADSYTITHGSNASSAATGGGASVAFTYRVGEVWINDRDINNLSDFKEKNDSETAAATASYSIGLVLWMQGEADEGRSGTAQSWANTEIVRRHIFDRFFEDYPDAMIITTDLAHREGATANGRQNIREMDIEIAGDTADVYRGPATYDLDVLDPADGVHLTDDEQLVYARRLALVCAKRLAGQGLCENPDYAYGPYISSNSVNTTTGAITSTVTHDGGDNLNDYSGTPITVSNATNSKNYARFFSPSGAEITYTTHQVTGASQLQFTSPSAYPTSAILVKAGYGSMTDIDIAANVVYDNSADELPLQTSTHVIPYSIPNTGALIQDFSTVFSGVSSNTTTISSTTTSLSTLLKRGWNCPDASGSMNQITARRTYTNATTASTAAASAEAFTGDLTFYNTSVQWSSDIVDTVQRFDISLTTTTATNTATITSVDTARSVVIYDDTTSSSANTHTIAHHAELTNATTVTATASTSLVTSTRTVGGWVVQFKTGVVNSIQQVSIDIAAAATSNTATVTGVDLGRSVLFQRGYIKTAGTSNAFGYNLNALYMTNATTATAQRGVTASSGALTDALTVKGTLVEFNQGFLAVQHTSVQISGGGGTTGTTAIIDVPKANSFILWGGHYVDSTSSSAEDIAFGRLEWRTASDTDYADGVTHTRTGTSSVNIAKPQIVTMLT